MASNVVRCAMGFIPPAVAREVAAVVFFTRGVRFVYHLVKLLIIIQSLTFTS